LCIVTPFSSSILSASTFAAFPVGAAIFISGFLLSFFMCVENALYISVVRLVFPLPGPPVIRIVL